MDIAFAVIMFLLVLGLILMMIFIHFDAGLDITKENNLILWYTVEENNEIKRKYITLFKL